VSKKAFNHWIQVFKKTGDVEEKKSSGQKKKITSRKEDEMIFPN
jgi:transposase